MESTSKEVDFDFGVVFRNLTQIFLLNLKCKNFAHILARRNVILLTQSTQKVHDLKFFGGETMKKNHWVLSAYLRNLHGKVLAIILFATILLSIFPVYVFAAVSIRVDPALG